MTVTPWSDAAKALVGAAFGDPEMRAEAEKMDLERQKFELQNKQYQLEEALNPAKIKQAEAAAAYNNAQTQSEAIKRALDQVKLDSQQGFLDGLNAPTMAPMPEFNPMNVGPQGQGRNPAITTPYDQIQPLEMGVGGDINVPKGPPPELVPLTMDSLSASPADPFGDLITSLTDEPVAPMAPLPPVAQPPDLASMLTPEIRTMIAAGYLPGQSIGDYLLAQEAFNANQGVTDPNKRILNAAAGRGTFASPDQVTAQAMGSTLPTARLSELGEQNMGTNDIKNFNLSQANPDFAEFLATQNAGQEIEFNPDGTIKRIGKGGSKGKPMTEQQGKNYTSANAIQAPLKVVETMQAQGYEPSFTDYTLFTQTLDSPLGASVAVPNMSAEGQQYYGAVAPIAATIANILSGQGMSDAEQRRRLLQIIPIPGEDPKARQLKFDLMRSYFESAADTSGQPLREQSDAPVQIQDDAGYEALPSGTTFTAPDGTIRTKP